MKICYVCYTNSKCSDIWEMFIKQQNKHTDFPIYFISDIPIPGYEDKTFIYNNDDKYYSVWIDTLKSLDYDYFIYLQEDFLLYENVNNDKLGEYLNFLIDNQDYSFVRLIKSGHLGERQLSNTLYEIESSNPFIFAMQATLWKKCDYIKLMDLVKEPKWLETDKYRTTMNNLGMKGTYHYDNEPKRGGCHYDTNVYPYIATALVKGRWNVTEYSNELSPILTQNNIDLNLRGVF